MNNWLKIFVVWGLSLFLYAACAGWEFKTPGDQPASTQEEPTPQGKTSIGGELGKEGRGADR